MTTNTTSYSVTIIDGSSDAVIFDAAKYFGKPQEFHVVFKGYYLEADVDMLFRREVVIKTWVYGVEWERDDKKKPTGFLRIKALIQSSDVPQSIGDDVEIHFEPRRRKGGIVTR